LGFLALSDVSNREDVVKLKTLAVRRGLWFKALSALERATVDLTIRVVEKVRSPTLKSVLRSIAFKVIEALKSRSFKERAVAIGQALVERLVRVAERFGCKRAEEWTRDLGFIMYLGVSWLNTPPVFRSSVKSSEAEAR
jgi:ATP-dependent RNA circularization protein (DNA/RNA ligase family)